MKNEKWDTEEMRKWENESKKKYKKKNKPVDDWKKNRKSRQNFKILSQEFFEIIFFNLYYLF